MRNKKEDEHNPLGLPDNGVPGPGNYDSYPPLEK